MFCGIKKMKRSKELVYIYFTKLGVCEINSLLAPTLVSLWTFDVPLEGTRTSTIWPHVFSHFINISAPVVRGAWAFVFSLIFVQLGCLIIIVYTMLSPTVFWMFVLNLSLPPYFKNVIYPAYSLKGCTSFSKPFIFHFCSRQPYYHSCRFAFHSASISPKKKGCGFYRGVQAVRGKIELSCVGRPSLWSHQEVECVCHVFLKATSCLCSQKQLAQTPLNRHFPVSRTCM